MIYNGFKEYKLRFYNNVKTGEKPVEKYLEKLDIKEQSKIAKFIEFLRLSVGCSNPPFIKHIKGKIWELKVDFSHNKYRLFYFIFIKKTIIILHVFRKKTAKTPKLEISTAEKRYHEVLENKQIYE